MQNKRPRYPFQEGLEKKFEKWNGFIDDDIREAIKEISGDTYLEMRKLTSLLLTLVEQYIAEGKYPGYKDGIVLTDEEKQGIMNTGNGNKTRVPEDLKKEVKDRIDAVWVSILNKQKVGFDKLFIALSQTYKQNDKEN